MSTTEPDNQGTPAAVPAPEESTDLAPLSIIRSETVLSRLPIHNLAKRGRVDIQITRTNGAGEVELLWRVSPSRDYGEPRQLAYKLDTIVVNRRLDELGRPLPRVIKLGSLRDVAIDLGLGAGNTGILRQAILQNVGTLINAKLTYRGNDGSERRLEAAFTRYSVVFTGEKLPNGKKADAVHLILNEPYWEVLNNAPYRPLDYDYLKALTPGAQRFYEIVSYRMFAALKYDHPEARLPYSEYCTYSTQQRYEDYDRFKKQMYKVHRPHLASGYLKSVRYEATTDAAGKPDWIMCYEPGRKARAAHRSFTATGFLEPHSAAAPPVGMPAPVTPAAPGVGRASALALVQKFHYAARGVKDYAPYPGSREVAQASALLRKHGSEKAAFIVDYAVRAAERTRFEMRSFGALLQYVDEGLRLFANREANEETQRRDLEEAAARKRAENQIAALSPDDRQALRERVRVRLNETHPTLVAYYEQKQSGLEPLLKNAMIDELLGREPRHEA